MTSVESSVGTATLSVIQYMTLWVGSQRVFAFSLTCRHLLKNTTGKVGWMDLSWMHNDPINMCRNSKVKSKHAWKMLNWNEISFVRFHDLIYKRYLGIVQKFCCWRTEYWYNSLQHCDIITSSPSSCEFWCKRNCKKWSGKSVSALKYTLSTCS